MRYRIILKYIIIYLIYEGITAKALINNSTSCGIGCLKCNKYSICTECDEGFELNSNINKCINKQCQNGLFYQDQIPINNCKSLCSNNYFQSIKQRLCIKLEECTLSYRSTQNININDTLNDIISLVDDFVLLVYKKSIIQLRRSNGNIEYQTLINDNISSLYVFGNQLYIIKDNSIYKWNLLHNKFIFLVKLEQIADLQKKVDIQLLNINNQSVVSIYLSPEQQMIMVQQQFNLPDADLKQNNLIQIEYSSQNIIKFYKSAIIQIGNEGIRLDVVETDINKNVVIKNLTYKQYFCGKLNFKELKMVEYETYTQSYLLIFENSQVIYKINNETCTQYDQQQNPLKLATFYVGNFNYFAVKYLTSIIILDNNLTEIKNFEYNPINIIDFIIVNNQINQITILLLHNNSYISYINANIDNQQIIFSQINQQIEVFINNPYQLFYLPQISQTNLKNRLFIVGSEIQSNIILDQNNLNNNEKQEYLIVNYEFSYDFVSNKIISSLALDNLDIFVACSQEGVFAWDVSHIYSSQILYFFKTLNDPCIEINYIKNSDISITFASKIIIIDVNYFTLKQTFKLNTSTSLFVPKISFQQTYGILIFDQNLFYCDIETFTLTKLQFTDYNNNIQLISLQEGDILIIQFLQSFKLYTVDYQKKQANSYNDKQFLSKIIKTKIRNFPQKKFEIITYLENKTFLIIDQSLSSITEVLNFPLSSLLDIQFLQTDPNDDSYFILGRSAKVSTAFPVEKYYLSKQNPKPLLSFQASSGLYLLEPIKKTDSNNQIFYLSYLVYWQATYSLIATLSYYPSSNINFFQDFIYMFQSINSKIYKMNDQKNYILADSKGYIGALPIKNDFYTSYYKINQQDQDRNNLIVKIIQSFVLNKVFIIKTKTILIFNIHTNIFEEEIIFESNLLDSIQKYYILEQENILVASKNGVLLIKDFQKNITQSLEQTSIFSFYIYYKNNQAHILVYRNIIQSLKLDLTPQIQNSYAIEQDTIQKCRVSKSKIICQLTKQNKIIILNEETLQLLNTIIPFNQISSNYFYLDEEYQKIYIYSKIMEIYSYDGQFIDRVNSLPEIVTELKINGETIILIQSSFQSYVSLYDRNTYKLKTIFTIPTSGYILSSLIVVEYSHLLISIDNIQFAQILVYSLVDLILYSFVKNTLIANIIAKVISIRFDKDFNQLAFLDVSSNLTIISYKNLQQTHSCNKIYEFSYQKIKQPKDLEISFENNNGFVYNELIAYQVNYSRQTSFFTKYEMVVDRGFTKFPQQTQQTLAQNNYYLLMGQNNTFYIYYDQNFIYFGKLKQPQQIQDIKYLQNYNSLVFISQKLLFVYDLNQTPFNLNISIDSKVLKTESKYSIKIFLCQNIFQTYDNQIIHYDFQSMTFVKEINIKFRISKALCSETDQILVVGFIDGNQLLYDIKAKNITNYPQSMSSHRNHIKYAEETENFIWLASLNGSSIGINKSSKQIQFQFNFNEKLNINNKDLFVFRVDEDYHRIFINYFGEKKIYCFNYLKSDISQNIIYLSFPDSAQNKIKITETQIILYSTSQLNIHDKVSLKYLISIRRNIYYDNIVTLRVFQEQYYFILSLYKFELFKIDFQKKQVHLLDQIVVNYLQLIDTVFDQQSLTLKIIGLLKNQVFQETYSLQFYENKLINGQIGCSLQINQLTFQQMTNQISFIKPVYQQLPSLLGQIEIIQDSDIRLISIDLKNNDFSEINFEATQNSQLIIQSPQQINNEQKGIININDEQFKNFSKQDLKMQDFEFIFSKNSTKIQFSQITKNIYLKNISISNQTLVDINIVIYNMNEVIIDNITFEYLQITLNNKTEQYSFLEFLNCESLVIINMKLKKIQFLSYVYGFFLRAYKLTKIQILNLDIEDSTFNTLFLFQDIQQLQLQNINIINCTGSQQYQIDIPNFMRIEGVQISLIFNVKMMDNINLLFLDSDNTDEQNFEDIRLTNDVIRIQNSKLKKNLIKFSTIISLIKINATSIMFIDTDYFLNNANIVMIDTTNVQIVNCNFNDNQGINGGAISFFNNKKTIYVSNSTFTQNSALGSGGAVYFKQQIGDIIFDNKSKIKNNIALIGGGIRIQNLQIEADIYNDEKYISQIPSTLLNENKASIYGQQFALNLEGIQIQSVGSTSSSENFFINHIYLNQTQLSIDEQLLYSGKLQIQGVKSGDTIQIAFQVFDHFGDNIYFSPEKYIQNNYTQDIQNELSQYQFRIESQNQKIVVLNGQTLINSEAYNITQKLFIFKEVQVIGYPNNNGSLIINYQINNKKIKPILVNILFKSCKVGEILKLYNGNIYSCQQCPFGTYQLYQFKQYNSSENSQNQNQSNSILKNQQQQEEEELTCQKCPSFAESCEGSQIILKQGYWRQNVQTDKIFLCYNNPNNCNEQSSESKNGCVEGLIGPLCEVCDLFGDVWNGKQFTRLFASQFSCGDCSNIGYQILIFLLFSFFILVYSLISTILFMNSFFHTQSCYYLRQLNILPISKSSIKDSSSFCLKILINYLQITSLLVKFQLNIFQQYLSESLNSFQSPSSKTINSLDCLISRVVDNRIEKIRVNLFIYALNPIIYTLTVALCLKLFQKFKLYQVKGIHIYTLINFMFIYFQPNSVTYFIQSLVCRKIGNEYYSEMDLTIQCDNKQYNKFVQPFSGTVLLVYIFLPLYCFYQLRKEKTKLLNCLTKYKYGFFYSEYKSKYYYWEFIRINFRVLILAVFILLNQNKSLAYLIIIFLISIYIKSVLVLKPIQVEKLQNYEILCFYAIIINIVFYNINQQYNNIILETFFYLFHLSVLFYLILAILHQKIFSRFNIIGKSLYFLMKYAAPKSLYNKLKKKNTTDLRTFFRWKLIRKKLQFIIVSNSCQVYKEINLQEQKRNKTPSITNYTSQREINNSYQNSNQSLKNRQQKARKSLLMNTLNFKNNNINQSIKPSIYSQNDPNKSIECTVIDQLNQQDLSQVNLNQISLQNHQSQEFSFTMKTFQNKQTEIDKTFETFMTIPDENINDNKQKQKNEQQQIQSFQQQNSSN